MMINQRRYLFLCVLAGFIVFTFFSSQTSGLSLAQSATESPNSLNMNFKQVGNDPILEPGPAGEWDAVSVRFPEVVYDKGTYYLFYGTFQTMTDPVSIGLAESNDGIHWTKLDKNPILKGSGEGFDAFGVTRPVVMVEADGTWILYYNGIPAPNMVFGKG